MRVLALVAAAGRSGRMGSAKALLPFGDHDDAVSFVAHVVAVCRVAGCDDVVVSVPDGIDGDRVRAAVVGTTTITNPQPTLGISGSIIAALDHDDAVDALLLWPVDCPFADVDVVRALIASLADDAVDAVVPLTPAGRGHPVLLRASTFALVRTHANDGGPRRVLNDVRVAEVFVGDVRLAMNLNTPADWQRAFQRDRHVH